MNPDMVPVITFVGLSGTGKTTFLEKLIPEHTETICVQFIAV